MISSKNPPSPATKKPSANKLQRLFSKALAFQRFLLKIINFQNFLELFRTF
jgi:hypothetical protein